MATGFTEFLDNFVKNHDNRQLLAFPLAILAVSLIILLFLFKQWVTVTLGMEFQGGTQISVETISSPAALKEAYSSYHIIDARQAGSRIIMDFGVMDNKNKASWKKMS